MSFIKKISKLLSTKQHKFTSAVILAGGTGSRVGAEIPKQHLIIDGIEVVVRSMLAFEKSALVDEIVIVCLDGESELYSQYKSKYGISKLTAITAGGNSRSESALKGFESISKKAKYVAIHDAARCLTEPDEIDAVIREAYKHRCATAAMKCTDTVKIADTNGFISETPDRSKLYLAATPQVFDAKIYMTAAYSAKKDKVSVTDDNSMAERLGFRIKLVETRSTRMKITHPDDIIIAEAIIKNNLS